MNASRTARERARAELTREIKEEARRQLRASGAQGLSLRAVARELGMVSSALYRYFPSRDELLTALIIDAYDALGARIEAAAGTGGGFRERWRACCAAVRDWAREHPHEYALVYGSPVPGYQAPEATIAPASRVPVALLSLVRDAWREGVLTEPADELSPELAEQAERTAAVIPPAMPGPLLVRGAIAWTQLFGMVGFELFGHLDGTMDPAGPFFAHSVERMADFLGLPPA
ncbi:TetR/AcrR family transcriptional regulator [Spirillospora sp. NPDC029432]|uniref:TetR/AcrR family transcriptional regulator n=1 Tax=Spirillospora sp. NPDC029432 TaxID=3154599 RepID=UPI00345623BF